MSKTVVKTCEEFSSRRKVRYGFGDSSSPSGLRDKPTYSLTPSSVNASLSPHKVYYTKDGDENAVYVIEFNIGNFEFQEIVIKTEGKYIKFDFNGIK
jgi:hypothetical protein